jgi:hypothetical protein
MNETVYAHTSGGGSLIDRKHGAPDPLPFRGSKWLIMVCMGWR